MKKLITIVFTVAFLATAGTAMASVLGTPHDYRTAAGDFGLCNACHTPHAAKDQHRIWQATVTWNQASTAWADSNVGQLCGGCHLNGGVLTAQNSNTDNPHITDTSVYDADSHGRNIAELGAGANNINDVPANVANRPYLSNANMECTSCHDPHDNSVMPFLRNDGTAAMDTITEVCTDCHDRSFADFGLNNVTNRTYAYDGTTPAGEAGSMHPANVDYADATGNENSDSTVLRTLVVNGPVNTTNADTSNWTLGGKLTGTASPLGAGFIGCQTCHAVHGTPAGATGTPPNNIYLLAINNNGSFNNAPLCETCHGGGLDGSGSISVVSDGAGGSGTGSYYVGRNYLATDTVGQPFDDHPIDVDCDGTPALLNWAAAGNVRWERTAWGARTAGDPMGSRWPAGTTASSYVESGIQMGRIICTSCHSAHNGLPGTSLRRKGGVASGANTGQTTSDQTAANMADAVIGLDVRTSWCYNCHQVQDMVPSYHHSTNDTGGAAANYDAGDMLGGSSGVSCSDCHSIPAGSPLTAHNGFFNLNAGKLDPTHGNADSDLCVFCHGTTDPTGGGSYPAGNAHTYGNSVSGTGSHYIGTFSDGDTVNSLNVKRGWWRQVPYKGNPAQSVYSKYGGNTDTHHTVAPAPHSGTQTVICESCHSVLFNAGWDGRASVNDWEASQGTSTVWSRQGGWKTNLLLQLYEDRAHGTNSLAHQDAAYADSYPSDVDGVDTGANLCIACHNRSNASSPAGAGTKDGLVTGTISYSGSISAAMVPANMHPMTGWTITRAVDSGRAITTLVTGTADGTYADAAYSPDNSLAGSGNSFHSYPTADAMDCDSCHSPHTAMSQGFIPGLPKTGSGAADSVSAIVQEVNIAAIGGNGAGPDDTCLGCHNR